jgi:hypothetical protein
MEGTQWPSVPFTKKIRNSTGNTATGEFTWVQIKTKGYPQRIVAETTVEAYAGRKVPVSEDATPEELAQAMFTIFTFMEK